MNPPYLSTLRARSCLVGQSPPSREGTSSARVPNTNPTVSVSRDAELSPFSSVPCRTHTAQTQNLALATQQGFNAGQAEPVV